MIVAIGARMHQTHLYFKKLQGYHMAQSSMGRSTEFKEVKDSTPIYHRQKSCCSSRFITERLAWGAATVGSALIFPIGLCSGVYRMCSDSFSRGLQTIAYSFIGGIKFTAISAVSTLIPQIGASYVRSWIIDTDDLFQQQPKDFFKQLDFAYLHILNMHDIYLPLKP